MDFSNKIVLVTGGAFGIGKATCEKFAKLGATVIMTDVNENMLAETRKAINYESIYTYVLDVSNEQQVYSVVEDVENKYGKIDILVNNAGYWRNDNYELKDSKSEYWKKKIEVNILGTMYASKAVINGMIEKGCGHIVNLSSALGVYGKAGWTDYSMTKGAVIAFTTALAKELGPYNINVNAVAPGSINSDGKPEHESSDYNFIGRSGTPIEVAELICFLAADENMYISGQNILIDGCRKLM